jgi:dTMP kinase
MEIIPNFVVFEGGDGSGTTTQLSMLTERLKKSKKPVFFPTFEPTDGHIGKIIRSALKKDLFFQPQTLAMLFAADRNEHLNGQDGILSHVKRGELVVSDRYVLSSIVYQGIECGNALPTALNSLYGAPELTFFFDIDPKTAINRMSKRGFSEIYEYLGFQEKVRQKYISAVENYRKSGARVEIIDSSKTITEIADQVWSIMFEMPIFNK